MITDHYETLGLTPQAEHSAIRAAYLALMRRYHPDRNQSADAAERAREVTAAYKVLGNRDRRMDYDMARAYARAELAEQNYGRWGFKRAAMALFAIAGFVLVMLLYLNPFAPEIDERIERQAAVRNPPPAAQKPVDPAARCASASNAKLIKQELFARAARVRGADAAVYRKLAAYSVIRLQAPHSVRSDADRRTLYCNAAVGLDLPPGVAIPGGRTSVTSDIGYSLKSGGDGRDALELFHAGTIARDLATLVSVRAPADQSAPAESVDGPAPAVARPPAPIIPAPPPPARVEQPRVVQPPRVVPPPRVVQPPRVVPPPRVAPPRAEPQQPQKASPGVGGLDRALGALFTQSVQRADAAKRRTLYRDHYRFIARLNRCSSEACSRSEYLGRMREISNTMTGTPAR